MHKLSVEFSFPDTTVCHPSIYGTDVQRLYFFYFIFFYNHEKYAADPNTFTVFMLFRAELAPMQRIDTSWKKKIFPIIPHFLTHTQLLTPHNPW